VLIYCSDVAGRQPALDQGGLCGLGQAGVALHHVVASDLKLPGNADRYLATPVVHDAQLDAVNGPAERPGLRTSLGSLRPATGEISDSLYSSRTMQPNLSSNRCSMSAGIAGPVARQRRSEVKSSPDRSAAASIDSCAGTTNDRRRRAARCSTKWSAGSPTPPRRARTSPRLDAAAQKSAFIGSSSSA